MAGLPTFRCFATLQLGPEYRSGVNDLVKDFYNPVLSAARTYDRAVGYFTSAGLALAAAGLDEFSAHDGHMRLVASPVMQEDDVRAIERGLVARDSIVERRLLEALMVAPTDDEAIVRLAWLVAEGRLDVRIAVPIRGPGIYHEKLGVLTDADGCRIAFSGSANETVGGLVSNFESIDVFFSWDATADRVERKAANFERLWNNETPQLVVLDMPTAVREELIQVAGRNKRVGRVAVGRQPPKGFAVPTELAPRDYQLRAVESWLAAGGRGILSMATATGKTKTALLAAQRFAATSKDGLVVVVLAPFIHLVDQWAEECRSWGLHTVTCYESMPAWRTEALNALDRLSAGVDRVTCLVATIDTAGSDTFKALFASSRNVLLIADEVHNLGAGRALELLSDRFAGRLGLSATPERWKDQEGTEALFDYFGGVVFSFTIREAIAAGVLCPYVYEPVLVPLAGEELVEYSILMSQVERLATLSDASATGELARLLARRTTILNEAAGKIRAVREQLETAGHSWTLFYCASRTQLGAVVDLVHESGRTVRVFTAEEDRHQRQQLLTEFAERRIAVLAAMRALDEGVDIPDTREAHILASSGNPREFIQRRGRVLRPAPGKQLARIVDYITLPGSTGPWERRLVKKEMGRVLDFARDATNAEQARVAVAPILDRFDLLHMLGDHM